MAYTKNVASKQRNRHGRHTSYSDTYDWEQRRDASRHSLPYRAQQSEVQRPDGRRPKYVSSQRSKPPQEFFVTRSMPSPTRMLTRSGTINSRNRRAYEEEDEDEEDEKERLRGRMQSRSRSRVKIRPRSPSIDSSAESITLPTPTRSSYMHHRSAPPSAPSPGSASDSSSGDADSDDTEDYRPRTLKERMNGKSTPGTPESEPVRTPAASRSRSRRRPLNELVRETDSLSDESSEPAAQPHPRVVVGGSSRPQRKHAHQSRASSAAPRQHSRHRGRHREVHTNYSPKRSQNRYYDSDISYFERPFLSRSPATSYSRISSHSLSSSHARRSSTFPGNFFDAPDVPQYHPKSHKLDLCKGGCEYLVSSTESVRLKCGHPWCLRCLKKLFKQSIRDTKAMPPTCCTGDCIPTEYVGHLFKDEFKRIWNQKFAEASMKARDQKICPRRKCRARIRGEDIFHHNNGRTSATCHKCNTQICGICYNKWHESRKCPVGFGEKTGWKKCQKCQASVELKEGCSHMTCPCGAEFCTLCGVKWKTCQCPWFDYDSDEDDDEEDFEPVQMPVPLTGRGRLGRMDGPSRGPRPGPSFGHGGSHRPVRPDERARGILHPEDDEDDDGDDDEDDGYLDDFVDVMGVGSASGQFMSDDFRRSHSTLVPPAPTPPVPLPPPTVAPERTNAGANYVSGVNKARGVRGSSSMERLAGRFSEQRHTPQRSFGQPMSPPMHHTPTFGHPLAFQPPLTPISRRHTMNEDMYDMPFSPPFPGPLPRSATYDYMDDTALHAPPRRRRSRRSEQAGLTGPGNGMHRVYEWRNHIDPLDTQTVT